MSEAKNKEMFPLTAVMSSSKTRYGGRHNSLTLSVGGFRLGWFDASGEKWHVVHRLLSSHGNSSSRGQSGSKHTIDPKHSWSEYTMPPHASAEVMNSLFGTSVQDELNRSLGREKWIVFKRNYCLPRDNLNRFISSRCRDRTWCSAVRIKEMPIDVSDYIFSIASPSEEDAFFGEVRVINPPSAPAKERMRWRCEECGHEGYYEAFKERYLPGLATPTGLNCTHCDYREQEGIKGLLNGPTRGCVVRMPSTVIYPER